jgi:molybdenum cofactor cytidylyltransferase
VKFGSISIADAQDSILAHSLRAGPLIYKKGRRISADDIEALRAMGVEQIVVAQLDSADVSEDEAAYQLAQTLCGAHMRIDPPFTGRANIFATRAGVLRIDVATINAINALDERLTVATLQTMRCVVEGEMVATVKIIPFAIPRALVEQADKIAARGRIDIAPFRPMRVGVVSTLLPSLKKSTVEKTLDVLRQRLAPSQARIEHELRVSHDVNALREGLYSLRDKVDLLIVFGASAITDRRDIIPAAVEAVGGRIEQLGMPVDPGNLLLLGALDNGVPVIGAPGCARSPVENGFDWVLHRLLVGIEVKAADLRAMGVGGLLMEIISRPQPRAGGQAHDEA